MTTRRARGRRSPVDAPMHCMEIWGGHGETSVHFTRPGLDVWVRSQSRQDTAAGGGDLHLISSCASGRITRMVLADVCGGGPLFSETAARFRELLKRNVNSIQQTRAVRQMSRHLETAAQRGGFASTLMATYFAPTHSLALCNAGHPPPLLFRARAEAWSVFKRAPATASRQGASPGLVDPSEYQQFRTRLEAGDMVLSFSNALTECRRSDGRTIGLEGVLHLVERLDPSSPSSIPDRLVEQLVGGHRDNLADHDSTLLLCQATETPVAWRDRILAPFRLFRPVADRTTFAARPGRNDAPGDNGPMA